LIGRKRIAAATAILLAAVVVAGAAVIVRGTFLRPTMITAYFTSATAIYPGDQVRVSGVRVGTIANIDPQGAQAKLTLKVDRGVPIPADAKAVIVAQNLLSARYVQLTPAYETTGPTMPDGAIIPIERTAVPVEWDEVKTQLMRLATELGPRSGVSGTSVSRFIDSAANALDGNGDKLRQTLAQLSAVGRILADGGGNIVDIITNLQTFVTALRDSNQQIVQFEDRFATLTSVLNDSRSSLDAALSDLSTAVGQVQQFVAETRDKASEQVQRLANVTQTLADHKEDLENVLHGAPNAYGNYYNAYSPDSGTLVGSFTVNNFSNPVAFICGAIGGIENTTAPETAKLCAQYLGPALRLFNFNYLPFPTNPYLMKSASPANLIYSDPALAPGGAGPKPGPPEMPPAVSAYTGSLDNPSPAPAHVPFPAVAPGPTAPDHLPAFPSPALFPGAPVPMPPPGPAPTTATPTLPQVLLPAEGTPPS
jgi:phospholipid/cholesterol/gamma-HCH transport system substrate-binding protein